MAVLLYLQGGVIKDKKTYFLNQLYFLICYGKIMWDCNFREVKGGNEIFD